ncbi:MAG TPA: MMPL family transporter [Chloroflexia bacterium]|nr:MMPL family transporter [Chloroflexia bacterium]
MGKFLDRTGSFLFRKKWWAVGFWLLVLVVVGAAAGAFYKPASGAISIPGTPAQMTIDKVGQLFPGGGGGTGQIVFHTTDKKVSDFQAAIDPALAKVKAVPGVVNVVSPFVNPQATSADGKTAYAIVQMEKGTGQIDKETLSQVADITSSINSPQLEVERGGSLIKLQPDQIVGPSELTGLVIALAVLLLTFGALISAGMPLIIAVMGVGISIAGLFSLSQVIDINATTPALGAMLGLAVGIDYSLFIISKYRTLLLEGYGYNQAAGRAIGTAGNAVVFAASTVIIALAALSVVNIPFMTTMGLAGAASIAVAALLAVTLTPAILGIAGSRIFGRKTAQKIAEAQAKGLESRHTVSHHTFWYKWGQRLTKHRIVAIVLSLVVVGLLAYPVTDLTLGLPNDQYASPSSTQRKAYDLLANAFGVGYNAPLVVLVENVPPVTDADRAAVRSLLTAQYQKQVDAATQAQKAKFEKQAAAATTPELKAQLQQDIAAAQAEGQKQQQAAQAQLEAQIAQYSNLAEVGKIANQLAKAPDVKMATPAAVTADGKNGLIQVIPDSAPSDAKTSDLITYIRNNQAQASGNPAVKLGVTGYTALQDDISKKLADALPVYLLVVVGLSLVLLLLAFRSILVPLKATLGFLLSVMAMLGATVVVFQWGWFGLASPGPIISFIPIIGTGILFGLAMDYEFFLVSSIHEVYSRTGEARRAVESGFSLGAKVVTAAAAIMVAVFAGFAGSADANIKLFGVSLAVGIFVDAFIVRMTLVPAIMTLLGKAAWWLPGWLNKALPNLSIEGEAEEGTFVEEGEEKAGVEAEATR